MLDNSSLAAIQLRFAPQDYTVTEGGAVNITLEAVPPSDGYDFDFTVTLQYMNGSATGECVHVHKHMMCINTCMIVPTATEAVYRFIHSTAGSDYTPGPYTVTFTAGQTSATSTVSTFDDVTTELSEYFMVTINSTDQSNVVNIGLPNTAFITIEDNDPGMCVAYSVTIIAVSMHDIHTWQVGNMR